MKKLAILAALAISTVAFAADVEVSSVRDINSDRYGTRVAVSGGKLGFVTPTASVTDVGAVYTRYTVGGKADVASFGPVKVSANLGAAYQNSVNADNGAGLVYGVKASYDLTKALAVNAGWERFTGDTRVANYNGNAVTVGLSYKF